MTGFIENRGVYKRSGKTRWTARYRGADGRERARSFDRKEDARRWLSLKEAEVTTGDWVPPERARRSFGSLADEWLELHTGKPSTVAGYKSVLKAHLRPRFGSREVGSIERPEIRRFVADLVDGGLAPNSVRNILNCMKGVFSHALEAGAIKASPAAGVAAPRGERREMAVATDAQVAALADAVPAEYSTLIYAAAYMGLRAGELSALRVGDLDLMRGRAHVRRSVAEVHGKLVYGTPKSGRERTVSLPPFLRDMFAQHIAPVATDPSALVFTTAEGSAVRISNLRSRVFRPAADGLGLESLRFHDLRHTCAAFLIASGAHPRAIMERLGHSSITVTMDTYGHLLPSLDDELTDALEARYRSVS